MIPALFCGSGAWIHKIRIHWICYFTPFHLDFEMSEPCRCRHDLRSVKIRTSEQHFNKIRTRELSNTILVVCLYSVLMTLFFSSSKIKRNKIKNHKPQIFQKKVSSEQVQRKPLMSSLSAYRRKGVPILKKI